MLEVEGYISLRRLSSRLGFYLQERVADWRETNKREPLPKEVLIQHAQNIEGAAQYLAHSLVKKMVGYYTILTPVGAKFRMRANEAMPSYIINSDLYRQGKLNHRWVHNMGWKTFSSDDWYDLFETEVVFKKRDWKPYEPRLIDWESSTVDISNLLYRENRRSLIAKMDSLDASGIDWLSTYAQAGYLERGRLAEMRPFHGNSVVVPTGLQWPISDQEEDGTTQDTETPSEIIVSFATENPDAKKDEIKAATFPDKSGRWFDAHWIQAGAVLERLRRPGRRKTRRD